MERELGRLNIEIPKELKKKIKVYVAKSDRTIQEVVIEAVENYLKEKRANER